MLQSKLGKVSIYSVQCSTDTDETIVTTAIEIAKGSDKKVVIVAEDTDILALTPSNLEVFILEQSRPNVPENIYSLKSLDHLPNVLDNILLLHALTGCYTVSATFNQEYIKFIHTFQSYFLFDLYSLVSFN